jgi:DNA gyrase subunit A
MHVADLRTQGRATQGVKLINLKGKDQIAAVAKVDRNEDEEDEIDNEDESGKEIDNDNVE